MNQKFEKLINLISAVENALEKQDWDIITKLDPSVKPIIEAAAASVSEGDKARLVELVAKLQSLYDRISAENIARRAALGTELKQLHTERNAISQYMQSSGY